MTTRRYLLGLVAVFFVSAGAVVLACLAVVPARFLRLVDLVDVAVVGGGICVAVLAFGVGPGVLLVRRAVRGRLAAPVAAAIGAVLSPLCLLALWSVFREQHETLAGLLASWRQLPAELLLGVLPHALASGAFAAWIISARPRLGVRTPR